jgi:hypothetical protein
MTAEPTVGPPPHPLGQLTTTELSRRRHELESAIAFFEAQCPVPPARDRLQASLSAVIAEQDDRARIAKSR